VSIAAQLVYVDMQKTQAHKQQVEGSQSWGGCERKKRRGNEKKV